VYGNPCVVWVGRLNDVKDPLTALAAFSRALDHLPDARLWCAFGNAPLLYDVQRAIAADQRLAAAVTLLGSLPHARIETLLRAADIFLASSRREATGAALIEALACGATPVVTSIPAFRALTGNGTVGVLFRVGDAAAGADALVAAARRAGERGRVRAHFDEQYSLEALGRRLSRVYHELLQV
jgi:glycosyltransferase involved in cell wall biosynthesis